VSLISGSADTVRNFAGDYNNHDWKRVGGYAFSDTCRYLEKQRDRKAITCSMEQTFTLSTSIATANVIKVLYSRRDKALTD